MSFTPLPSHHVHRGKGECVCDGDECDQEVGSKAFAIVAAIIGALLFFGLGLGLWKLMSILRARSNMSHMQNSNNNVQL